MTGTGATEVVVVTAPRWADTVARRIAAELTGALSARGRAAIAVAGGATPRPAYQALAAITLPWNRIDVYFGDERAVPPEDPRANYRMARETLLDPAAVPAERRHRLPAERPDRERAAHDYADLLPTRLDVLLLGIGIDGHTASLYPGSWALEETARRVVPVEGPFPPRARLTVTPPVIAAARVRMVLARGRSKARAVRRALAGPRDVAACPAQLARAGVWFLDPPAAAALRRRPT